MRPTKWEKIANVIRNRILDGTYPPGGYFPTTLELMNEFEVYSATIQAAINILRNEKLIISAGKGKRIVRPLLKITTKKDMYDDMAFGKLSVQEISLCKSKNSRLPQNCTTPVLLYKSVLLNTDFTKVPPPISIIEYFIMTPTKDVETLNELESMLKTDHNLFDAMGSLGIIPFSYNEQLTVSNPSKDESNLLHLSTSVSSVPVVRTNRHVYSKSGELILICRVIDRADCYIYENSDNNLEKLSLNATS